MHSVSMLEITQPNTGKMLTRNYFAQKELENVVSRSENTSSFGQNFDPPLFLPVLSEMQGISGFTIVRPSR
jgi:hypothetical protein